MDNNTQKIMFSNKSDEHETPQNFYDKLHQIFNFTLDPCATDANHKSDKWFTIQDDGLSKSWAGYTVFCNPPYSKIKDWVKKSYEETKKDKTTIVVLLCPARTDTKYWHEYIMKAKQIHFIKGRLKFGTAKSCAPFPSIIAVFGCYPSFGSSTKIFTMEK